MLAAQSFGEKDEKELDIILAKAGLLHLKTNFVQEKVCVKIIQFLDNKDWDRLGVSAIGDRIVLVQLSKAQTRDETTSKEVREIFGPSSSSAKPSTPNETFSQRAEKLCGDIVPESFQFVKVYNRRVRQVDGDVPCDGNGLTHVYRSGSVYVRLKDTSLWAGDQKMEESDTGIVTAPATVNPSIGSSYKPELDSYSAFVNLISDSEDEEADFQRAIQDSLLEKSLDSVENGTLSEVLKDHIEANIKISDLDDAHAQKIVIRRGSIWKTTLRCFRQQTFECGRGLCVIFLAEEAVDAGGPLREFFRLLLKDISCNGSLMCGSENCRTAVHNGHALHQNEFKFVGQSIALSILYGGPGPHFFSSTAADYLLNIPIKAIPPEDVPDPEIVGKIKQIDSCETTVSLRNLLDSPDFEFRFDCGCSMPSSSISIDDQAYLSRCIAMHYSIYSCKAELDEIKEGLKVLNFHKLASLHPRVLKPLFVRAGQPILTAQVIIGLFHIEWSCTGSNRRSREEELILHWNYYVSELEGGREFNKLDGGTIKLNLGVLLSFITGADHTPPLGFIDPPQIEFTDDPKRILPWVSTCSLTVHLSLHLELYTDFESKMDEAVISAHGFGTI